MKLLAATICLAALSLTGCATDEETMGGAHLNGLRPAKPALDDGSGPPPNPEISGMQKRGMINLEDLGVDGAYAETINPDFPINGVVCDNCEVTLIRLPPRNQSEVGKILVVSDGGEKLCTIFLDPEGGLDSSDCNKPRDN